MFARFFKWTLLSILVGGLVGVVSYAFYSSLNMAIEFRRSHQWLVLFLPLVGMAVARFYVKYGGEVEAGNNLILDEIREPQKIILFRMAPMIFISSSLSHLFGASVGREGAAVQLGASLADQFSKYFGMYFNNRTIVLMAGMSAGFASIFGAPLAGTVFGLEILFLGPLALQAFFPCLIAAFVGHYTAQFVGLTHAQYAPVNVPDLSLLNLLWVIIAAACFGGVARFFIWLLHWMKDFLSAKCPNPVFRPLFGGIITIILFYLFATDRYQSLGEEIIQASFVQHVYPWDFLGKIFMTTLSLGSGFRGGEVMPLFYIGATLGNALSFILPLAIPFLSALGFVAVFAGAANVPITSFILAIGFFGPTIAVYAAIAVVVSYLVSGHKGIYKSHRKHRFKKF